MKHTKYPYIKTIVESGMPILLRGSAGTGKTTIAMQLAEDLSLPFYTMSMTKQTAVSALLGFISINGVYIPSQLRTAYESGGVFLLDEIDAGDPNVLLTLNTIENGFIAFPDGIVHAHPDFRLIATANPFNDHASYTGRSKLDFSTIDRYFIIELELDSALEIHLTSQKLYDRITIANTLFSDMGLSTSITMRDAIRMHRLESLGITDCVFKDIAFRDNTNLYDEFLKLEIPVLSKYKSQSDCTSVDELWEVLHNISVSSVDENTMPF